MTDTPILDALAKDDPDGHAVRHNGRIAFLHSDGRLTEGSLVDKAGKGSDSEPTTPSSVSSTGATKAAAAGPDNAVSHFAAHVEHHGTSLLPAANRDQQDMLGYHERADKAHEASATALAPDARPAAHTHAAQLHRDAADTLDRISDQATTGPKPEAKLLSSTAAAHRKIGAFHSDRAGSSSFDKSANSWEGGNVPPTPPVSGTGSPAHDEPATPEKPEKPGQYANWLSRGGRTKPAPSFQSSTRKPPAKTR